MNTLLLQLRKEAGLTQKSAAEKLGVRQSTISMWESGSSEPRLQMLKKIAEVYNCNFLDLLQGTLDATAVIHKR